MLCKNYHGGDFFESVRIRATEAWPWTLYYPYSRPMSAQHRATVGIADGPTSATAGGPPVICLSGLWLSIKLGRQWTTIGIAGGPTMTTAGGWPVICLSGLWWSFKLGRQWATDGGFTTATAGGPPVICLSGREGFWYLWPSWMRTNPLPMPGLM